MSADQPTKVQGSDDRGTAATVLTTCAVVVMIAGSLLSWLADLETVYLVTRIVALPLLLAAVVMALRRGARTSAIVPGVLVVLIAIYFSTEAF